MSAIRDFFQLGRSLPPKVVPRDAYGRGTVAAEAAGRGVSADYLRKARGFADPATGYSPAEVEELCRVIEAGQTGQPDAAPVFGRSHLIRLLSVPKRRRRRLLKRAVTEAWSLARLEVAIAVRFGQRRAGGRRRRLPGDTTGILAQTERLCEGWRRWAGQIDEWSGGGGTPTRSDGLPPDITELMRRAGTAVGRLQSAVTAELQRRQTGWSARGSGSEAVPDGRRSAGGSG